VKLIKHRPGDRVLVVIADIIVRIVFFIVGFVLVFGASSNRHGPPRIEFRWQIACVVGTAAAVLGPGIYRRDSQRGRGSLDEVKRQSRRDKE